MLVLGGVLVLTPSTLLPIDLKSCGHFVSLVQNDLKITCAQYLLNQLEFWLGVDCFAYTTFHVQSILVHA